MRRHVSFVALAGLVVLLSPRLAFSQPRDVALSTVTHELMSPFCPGLLLADCRSEGARELRAEIGRRLGAKEAADAIEADLVARFGPEIRTVPEFHGIGILAWIGPVLIGAGGFTTLVVAIRTATRSQSEDRDREGPAHEDPALRERIDDELADLD